MCSKGPRCEFFRDFTKKWRNSSGQKRLLNGDFAVRMSWRMSPLANRWGAVVSVCLYCAEELDAGSRSVSHVSTQSVQHTFMIQARRITKVGSDASVTPTALARFRSPYTSTLMFTVL